MLFLRVTATNDSDSQERVISRLIGPNYPDAGTVISTRCDQDTLVTVIANGAGGWTEDRTPTAKECTPPEPPSCNVLPNIAGEARVSETITFLKGEWTGAFVTYVAATIIDGTETAVNPANPVTLQLLAPHLGKTITYKVTGSNAWGEVTEISAAFGPIQEAYPVEGTVVGTSCQGYDLFDNVADGQGGFTYRLNARYSEQCGYKGPPMNITLPKVTGELKVGSTVSADAGSWTGLPALSYKWLSNDVEIDGETSDTLKLGVDEIGTMIKVMVTARKDASV